jgi:hypothetical protein
MSDDHRLDQIEARAHRAAADLHGVTATRPVPPFESDRPVVLDPARPASGGRNGRAPLLAAAALLLVALAATVTFGLRDDDGAGPAVAVGDAEAYQVVDLPEAFTVLGAIDAEPSLGAGEPTIGTADVYGPGPDEPGVVVWTLTGGDDPSAGFEPQGDPVATIAGHDVYDAGAIGGPADAALVDLDGTWVVVAAGDRATAEDVIGDLVVEAGRARVPTEGLPPGWSLVGTDAAPLLWWIGGTSPVPAPAFGGGSPAVRGATVYGPSGWTQDGTGGGADANVTLVWSETDGGELAAGRRLLADVAEVDIGRLEGFVGTTGRDQSGEAWPVVAWETDAGTLIRLVARGFERDEALAMARSVAPLPSTEFADLVRQSQLGFLAHDPNAVAVGQGTFGDGTAWMLWARSDDGSPSVAFADLRVAWGRTGDGSGSSSTGRGSQSSSADGDPVLTSVAEVEQDGRRYAAGLLGPGAQVDRVVIRQGGEVVGEATLVGTGEVRGWAVELPEGAATVEALAADGSILASRGLSSGTDGSVDGLPPGSTTTIDAGGADPASPG